MKKNKAIEILNNQIHRLDNIKIYRDETWIYQTASYIKDFFGENSTEYKFITEFVFDVEVDINENGHIIDFKIKSKMENMKQYLKNCIEKISTKGLYKHPKTNFFNGISETAIWTIISISIPGLLTIGTLFGNMYSDKQNIELRLENKKLKDSLSTFYKNNKTN